MSDQLKADIDFAIAILRGVRQSVENLSDILPDGIKTTQVFDRTIARLQAMAELSDLAGAKQSTR